MENVFPIFIHLELLKDLVKLNIFCSPRKTHVKGLKMFYNPSLHSPKSRDPFTCQFVGFANPTPRVAHHNPLPPVNLSDSQSPPLLITNHRISGLSRYLTIWFSALPPPAFLVTCPKRLLQLQEFVALRFNAPPPLPIKFLFWEI